MFERSKLVVCEKKKSLHGLDLRAEADCPAPPLPSFPRSLPRRSFTSRLCRSKWINSRGLMEFFALD